MARNKDKTADPLRGGRMRVPRTRGAVSGITLAALGAWGALIPFIGPIFDFGYSPNQSWQWTAARGWLEVLPGVVAFVGALLLLTSANRVTASFGGWLAVAAGAWFVVGANFSALLHLGTLGEPLGSSTGQRLLESLTFFDGLGAIMLFIAAGAVGRLSVRSVRDVRSAQRRDERDDRNDRTDRDNRVDDRDDRAADDAQSDRGPDVAPVGERTDPRSPAPSPAAHNGAGAATADRSSS